MTQTSFENDEEWSTGKPEKTGVYERSYGKSAVSRMEITHYNKWDGNNWYCWESSVDAARKNNRPSHVHHLKWREIEGEIYV